MKIRIGLKTPDALSDAAADAAEDAKEAYIDGQRRGRALIDEDKVDEIHQKVVDEVKEVGALFFRNGESVTLEIDTEAKTCVVIPVKSVDENPKWLDDKLQFARLLCEISANWDETDAKRTIRAIANSMDLTVDEVNELFDRADKVWEAAKG